MTPSPYQVIKRSIADGIASGQWRIGQALPSEHALVRQFSVSRMTVNRAMRELANENLIRRVPGVGSFVAEPAAQSALVEIHNIADEIAARLHVHAARVLDLGRVEAPADVAASFDIRPASSLYFSRILHLEDGVPLQLEQRYVDPRLAPDYLEQDYAVVTPHTHLSRVAPLLRGEHQVRAILPNAAQAGLLAVGAHEPCLVVVRRTWSEGGLVSLAELWHPGTRFALSGRFENTSFRGAAGQDAP